MFGEALGRFYADKFGVSVACLRIGTCREPDRPGDARHLHTWISHRDTVQLVRRCLDHPHYHFLIAYGVSNNTRGLWDNSAAQFLGYLPVDNAEAYAEEIQGSARAPDPISALFHGGDFCSQEFAGRLPEID